MRYLLTLLFLFIFSSGASAAGFIVVVNSDGPLSNASASDIRAIYLGDKRFGGKVKFNPVNFTEGELKDAFLGSVVDMNSKEYKLHWIKKVFQEGLTLPKTMGDAKSVLEFVKGEKGALAYLPESYGRRLKGVKEVVVINP